MIRRVHMWMGWLAAGILLLSACSMGVYRNEKVEELNHRAFNFRYTDLDSMAHYARLALELTSRYATGKSEAYNHLAMASLMRQDFLSAEQYYALSLKSSDNQLEHLISDVGMMRICQRTASNKRFYDYYNKAARSISHLREEIDVLDEHDRGRLTVAESDFHLAASTYFYYMQQEDRARMELMQLNLPEVAKSDSIQWAYGLYVWGTSGLQHHDNRVTAAVAEFDDLLRALIVSRMKGAVYLEANILQTYSELFADSLWNEAVRRERHSELAFVQEREVSDSLLPLHLSRASLAMFELYGDHYQVAGAHRSLAELLFYREQYDEALAELQEALAEVNRYHQRFAPEISSANELKLYDNPDSLALEMWILDHHPMRIVPQWMANIRESISMAYSALGCKSASDYNRNIYLDILERTRQDKELESRFEQLETENYYMGALLSAVLLIVLVGIVGFLWLNRIWSRKNAAAIRRLQRVAQLCNRISSGLPDESEEMKSQAERLVQEDESLVGIIRPYQEWSEQYATTLADLEEEHQLLEKEKYLHEQHVSDYKRQNLDKRTCMSIVYGITPFLDRMINEVRKLKADDTPEVCRQRYTYIRELVDRINEYNDILALWIKMKQGTMSLHIENFALNELFETIAKGRRLFEQKQITLDVQSTDACVKADKALTLFIINTLTDNARKYTPAGGRVTVKAGQAEQYVEISVEDTGCGLSEADVRRILEEKVYDSSQIGLQEGDNEAVRQNKGFGFGLMNCKGIIDKYRKTNALFSVCRFGIESEVGKGSRFFFRLPKGVLRYVVLVLMTMPGLDGWAQTAKLLDEASRYADSTYYYNIDGEFEKALLYADTACYYLNRYYQTFYPADERLMSMTQDDGLAELDWWREGVETDYHIILDIRNEAAVASLATCQWQRYKLNNQGYTRMYKLLAEDSSLEAFCRSTQRAASNRILAIWLIVILVVVFLVAYYMLYFRHAQLYRMNMEQALLANQKILHLTNIGDAQTVLNNIYPDLNDIHPIKGLALRIDDRDKNVYPAVATQSSLLTPLLESQLRQVAETLKPVDDGQNGTRIVPLQVELGGETYGVGAFAFIQPTADYTEQDELLNDLILRYLAIMIYQTLIRLTLKQSDVELAEDEKRRTIYEENLLHVQNQMLDNCLSALKHETMYYPNRIRQMADSLMKHEGKESEAEQIHTMRELIDYYKEVFTLLSSCASRQVMSVKLARTKVPIARLFQYMEKYFAKRVRKTGSSLALTVDCDECCAVVGDEHLLRFLMENLVDAALQQDAPEGAEISMKAKEDGDFVHFTFADPRGNYTQEYLNALFYPDIQRMQPDESGKLKGVQYLMVRQIIRDHEELCNHRGCRINAEVGAEGRGYLLWFTLRNK